MQIVVMAIDEIDNINAMILNVTLKHQSKCKITTFQSFAADVALLLEINS